MNDYIPSNRHGDYLMHYGIKGMKWKDHDYVEDFKDNWKSGYGMIKSSAKSNLKKLKKLVGKAKSEVIKKVDPKLQERDYVKNHKVHEEQDKREASIKRSQSYTAWMRKAPYAMNTSNSASIAARADMLEKRARLSERPTIDNKERLSSIRMVNSNADKYVKDAERKVMKDRYNIGRNDAGQNRSMQSFNERRSYTDGVNAVAQNKLKRERREADERARQERNKAIKDKQIAYAKASDSVRAQQNSRNQSQANANSKYKQAFDKNRSLNTSQSANDAQRSRNAAMNTGSINGKSAVANNILKSNRRDNSNLTSSRDKDMNRGVQNGMIATSDSKARTSAQADANINRLASQASPKRPDPNPIAYTPNEIDAKLKVKDDTDLKKYLHSKKNKSNR